MYRLLGFALELGKLLVQLTFQVPIWPFRRDVEEVLRRRAHEDLGSPKGALEDTYQVLRSPLRVLGYDLLGQTVHTMFYGILHLDVVVICVLLQCPCLRIKSTVLDERLVTFTTPSDILAVRMLYE